MAKFWSKLFIVLTFYTPTLWSKRHLRRLCSVSKGEHIEGEWIEVPPEHQKKSFTCCGWDFQDWRHNTEACSGFQKVDKMYIGSDYGYAHLGGNACVCDAHFNTRQSVSKRESYIWRPKHCAILPWDATLFCELLGDRRVLFIGDSTMEQTASTLMSMIFHQRGGCARNIMFDRSDCLHSDCPGTNPGTLQRDMETVIKIAVRSGYEPHIVVINAGPHLHEANEIYKLWNAVLPQIMRHKHISFIWKSINPGHLNCTSIHSPDTKYLDEMVKMDDPYDWKLFPHFDNVSREVVKNHSEVIRFLDMSPLYFRADAHAGSDSPLTADNSVILDCLHYCAPGPIDLFSNLLLTMMATGEVLYLS